MARLKENEIDAISVVTLSFALLENLQDISDTIPGLMEIYLKELSMAETPDYSIMLLQGILLCLWYDLGTTLSILVESGNLDNFMGTAFSKITDITEDFEVKRFMLGLSSLLVNQDMPDTVKANYQTLMQALVHLSAKSIEIKQKE